MTGSNVWAVVLGRLTGVPVVVAHEHSWAFSGSPGRRLLDRHLIARGSDALIACSAEDRRRMIEVEGIAPRDVVLVPNGDRRRAARAPAARRAPRARHPAATHPSSAASERCARRSASTSSSGPPPRWWRAGPMRAS